MKRAALCALLMLLFWNGSEARGQGRQQLRLRLTTVTPTVCFGSTLKVRAELLNESGESVAIDANTIWYQIHFNYFRGGRIQPNPDGTATGRNTGGSKTMVGDPGPDYEGAYLVLRPGGSYRAERAIKLTDDFFNNPGGYGMTVTYGQFQDKSVEGVRVLKGAVVSNPIKFKVGNCGNPKGSSRKSS